MSQSLSLSWETIESILLGNKACRFDPDRKFIAFSAKSLWAKYFLPIISERINIVGCYDESLNEGEKVQGLQGLRLSDAISLRHSESKLAIVDFSRTPFDIGFNDHICREFSIQKYDFSEVLDFFDIPMMYEKPSESRKKTISLLNEYKRVYDALDDSISKKTLFGFLHFRIFSDRSALFPIVATPDSEYFNIYCDGDGHSLTSHESFVDIGAYTGDSVYKFMAASNFKFDRIDAFEPDKLNYAKLREAKIFFPHKIHLHRTAASDQNGEISFNHTGTGGSNIIQGGNEKVKTVRLDDTLEKVTLLKIDVEGAETKVIKGANQLINSFNPKLAIACYHYSEDLLNIFDSILECSGDYKFKLRHYSSYCGDTCLYAAT